MLGGYGYRMYLDDLPSATVLAGKTYFDTHIPLGYIQNSGFKFASLVDGEKDPSEKQKFFVYNHLDIEVTV